MPHNILPIVRVIIPFFKGEKYLEKCLLSVLDSDFPVEEILIVDNGNDQHSSEVTNILLKINNSRVRHLQARCQIGFGRACNVGVSQALTKKTDIIVLLNQDGHVNKNCLGELVRSLNNHPRAFSAVPISLTYEGNDILDKTVTSYLSPHTEYMKDLVLGTVKQSYAVPYNGFNGSCIAIPIDHLLKTGFFDPIIFMYGEERDLVYRAHTAGFKSLLVPGAKIGHVHSNFNATGDTAVAIWMKCRFGEYVRQIKNRNHYLPKSLLRAAFTIAKDHASLLLRFKFRHIMRLMLIDIQLLFELRQIIAHRDPRAFDRKVAQTIAADFVSDISPAYQSETKG